MIERDPMRIHALSNGETHAQINRLKIRKPMRHDHTSAELLRAGLPPLTP
jgi:hypothetical protein